MKRRCSPERMAEIAAAAPALIAAGCSHGSIADKMGCDRKTVWAICKKLGLKNPGVPTVRRQTRARPERAERRYAPVSTPLVEKMPFRPCDVPEETYRRADARIASAELARRILALQQKEAAR